MTRVPATSRALRIVLCAFGVWCAPALAEPPPAADAASSGDAPGAAAVADPTHLDRIDRLLEVTEFGATMDAFFAEIGDRDRSANRDASTEDAEVLKALVGYLSWRNTSHRWRAAFAARLTPEQADGIIAHYRSPAGRAMVECMKSQPDVMALMVCQSALSEDDRLAHFEFTITPAGEAWDALGRSMTPGIMIAAICEGLDRDPAMLSRVYAACGRNPGKGFCTVVKTGQGGGAELDRGACLAAADTRD